MQKLAIKYMISRRASGKVLETTFKDKEDGIGWTWEFLKRMISLWWDVLEGFWVHGYLGLQFVYLFR